MEGAELHPGRGALFVGLRGRQHGRGRKTQQARDDEVRELRRRIVELQRLVVVGLACKTEAVFGAGDLFGQRLHGGIGLEFRVALGHHHQAAQAAAEYALCRCQRAHGAGALRCGTHRCSRPLRLAAGLDDSLQRGGLVREIAARHLHQIGNQVIPALELHIDLAKRVGNAVAQLHQPVVDRHSPQPHRDQHNDHAPCGCRHTPPPVFVGGSILEPMGEASGNP